MTVVAAIATAAAARRLRTRPPRGQQSSEPAGAAALQVPATFGFRASAIDKMLRIEQDSSPDETGMVTTHQVDLSIHEARQLLQWIESQVDSEAE